MLCSDFSVSDDDGRGTHGCSGRRVSPERTFSHSLVRRHSVFARKLLLACTRRGKCRPAVGRPACRELRPRLARPFRLAECPAQQRRWQLRSSFSIGGSGNRAVTAVLGVQAKSMYPRLLAVALLGYEPRAVGRGGC